MNWKTLKDVFFANWKEKLLSVLLAILFWFMIKAQINRTSVPYGSDRVPRAVRM